MTFDVSAQVHRKRVYDWQDWFEVFSVCRNCSRPTTFTLAVREIKAKETFEAENALVKHTASLNPWFDVKGYVSLRDHVQHKPPEHLPEDIKGRFEEGAACLSIKCFNAASTMFRLCIDLATRPLLPEAVEGSPGQPNSKQRRDLGLRLAWLFDNNRLPQELRGLATCIREDGNDGAHAGSLTEADAEDLLDFTDALLDRLYTEPKRLQLAKERRDKRRQSAAKAG